MDMLNYLLASQVDHSLVRKLRTYTDPTLLVIDELGYLSLDQQSSNLFFQVISTRHSQKRSTIITTNTPFSEWGNILHNTTIATAIRSSSQLDRLERFYGDQGWELSLFAIADLQQADVVQTYTLVYCQDS
jgi:DNA replication protein DnaC